uniref:FERM domain-containing protein n=1 Tax=Strigamia maritima TaxID=126957 RepID=T1JHG8_STRMM
MTEGRRSQIVFLDERRLEIIIQPKLFAGELLDLVASHFNLKEKEYFGLAFHDETEHYNWLQLDKRVLDHELRKKTSNENTLVFYFLVKFFVESIVFLRDTVTAELFYLQAKSLVFKGQIEADSDTAFQLAAHVLQATNGDHHDDQVAKNCLKKLPVLPIHILKEHPSLAYCEDKVIAHYKKLSGLDRGSCLVNYMTIVEGLPTYGVHYFEVKDKSGIPWWLGLSFKGIAQYDYTDKKTPRKVFQWKQLENLYFRDRKFSIEVHDPKRIVHTLSSFNLYEDAIDEPIEEFDELSDAITDPSTQVSVSRRTFAAGNVTVYAWFSSSAHLTQCIWSMAISQHQFYLDRKQNKSQSVRNLGDIASELNQHSLSLPNENLLNNNANDPQTPTGQKGSIFSSDTESEVARAARMEMISALKARRDALEAKLQERTEELKELCIKEAELTGELPPELPLAPGEAMPHFRKRIGTAFSLPENLINRIKSKEEEVLAKLELDYEIQNKIASAALKLANDVSAKKSVRKQRKITYHQAHTKLKDIEERLMSMRQTVAHKKQMRHQVRKKQPRPSSDGEDHNDDSNSHSTEENDTVFVKKMFPSQTSLVCLEEMNNQVNRHQLKSDLSDRPRMTPSPANTSSSSTSSLPRRARQYTPSPSLPASPIKQRTSSGSSRTSSPSSNRYSIGGYIPNPVYTTKSAYRAQQYPTFSTRATRTAHAEYDNVHFGNGGGGVVLNPAYRNKYDAIMSAETRGLYSVPRQRTSNAFPSQEELVEHIQSNGPYRQSGNRQNLAYQLQNRYGSLDRTLYGTHSTHIITNSQPTAKVESRSLDNLDYPREYPSHTLPSPSTSGSHDTLELASSQDYLDCPISPHFHGDGFAYQNSVPAPVHVGYSTYSTPEWYEGYTYAPPRNYTSRDEISVNKTSPKVKEWYESSLDSPLPPRRSRQSYASTGSGTAKTPETPPADSEQTAASFVHVPCETPQNHVVVSQGQFQPYREITKPYELSDYYKYSTKVRKHSQSNTGSSDEGTRTPSTQPPTTLDLPVHQVEGCRIGSPVSPARMQMLSQRTPSPYAMQGPVLKKKNEVMRSPSLQLNEISNSSPLPGPSLADAFHEEMLAWYEDQDVGKQATLFIPNLFSGSLCF